MRGIRVTLLSNYLVITLPCKFLACKKLSLFLFWSVFQSTKSPIGVAEEQEEAVTRGPLQTCKMRLSKKVHPALDGEFLEALQLRDIFTVTDFLSTDPECVVNLAAGTFDGDIEDLREDLIEK